MSRRRVVALLCALAVCGGAYACSTDELQTPNVPPKPTPAASVDVIQGVDAGAPGDAGDGDAAPDDAPEDAFATPAFSACNAPSVKLLRAYDDDRTLAALSRCKPDGGYADGYDAGYSARIDNEQSVADQCGRPGQTRNPDLPRMLDSALPLDSATTRHVRALFREGRRRGRRAEVFGLVGDSITIDHSFMRPFSWTSRVRQTLSPEVKAALTLGTSGRTILDHFRGVAAADAGHDTSFDSYNAVRAAKVGVRANWALMLDANKTTPIAELVDTLSPAYAVVMYGTNDAEWYGLPLSNVAKNFGPALRGVVDALESKGVIPILTTIPKHMHDRRFPDCAPPGTVSNALYMVQTNVANATIAEVACEKHVPLIDFRYAIDHLLNHGVATDGVHPSLYYQGGAILDENGLQCGFNVRNLVTLRMLKVVHEAAVP